MKKDECRRQKPDFNPPALAPLAAFTPAMKTIHLSLVIVDHDGRTEPYFESAVRRVRGGLDLRTAILDLADALTLMHRVRGQPVRQPAPDHTQIDPAKATAPQK